MSRFKGTFDQRRAIRDALVELHERGVATAAIADAAMTARAKSKLEGIPPDGRASLSRATIDRYRKKGDAELDGMRFAQIQLLFAYLSQSVEHATSAFEGARVVRSSHDLAPLLSEFVERFGPRKGQIDLSDMASLEGTFLAYRRAWSSTDPRDHITSVMTIERVGDGYFFTDVQSYIDTTTKAVVDETDVGFAIPFGMSVVLVSKASQFDTLKFGSIDDFFPFPDTVRSVQSFSGNGLAISGRGPHPGYPFAARRVENPESARSEFLTIDDLDEGIKEALRRAAGRSHVLKY